MAQPGYHRKTDTLQPGDILVVVHDFEARGADELSLRKADRIELVELDDGFGDGWYLGRHLGREGTGLFPGVYTAKLPPHIAAIPTFSSSTAAPSFPRPGQTAAVPPTNPPPTTTRPPSPPLQSPEHRPLSYQHLRQAPSPGPSQAPSQLPPSSPRPMSELAASPGQDLPPGSTRNTMPSSATYIPSIQRSISETLRSPGGEDSPVMNETLSVIDEHITDLSTPRQSVAPPAAIPEDSESEYSSSHLGRGSFLAGPDSDSEDAAGPTREEVCSWDQKQVGHHLRSIGIDPKHCDIFEEQEITGDVLLDMDQSFIHMKEFDFGVMGKRLKTWHKIRQFQAEVKGTKAARQGSLKSDGDALSRVTSGGSLLPRVPSPQDQQNPSLSFRQFHAHPTIATSALPSPLQMGQSNGGSRGTADAMAQPSSWRISLGPDSPSRPLAAALRETNDSRRHSSIDFGTQPDLQLSSASLNTTSTPHKKQSSFDREWAAGSVTPASTNITSASTTHVIRKQESLDMSSNSPLLREGPNLDLDRGYFSGNEVDNRKARNVLRKRDSGVSPAHSRQSSVLDGRASAAAKRHSRLASVDSIRGPNGPLMAPASKPSHGTNVTGRYRSASARSPLPRQSVANYSPTVTNLETEGGTPAPSGVTSTFGRSNMSIKARKLMGLRAASDAVTENEKENAPSPTLLHGGLEDSPLGTPEDGSHTPSATSQSFEVDNTDTSSKADSQLQPMLNTKMSRQTRPKTKQQTSAYTKGLLKISPVEARKHCDHSGWMKKKSSSIVTTWKPRLFMLRGRRLSYYYAEEDSEERGIIDISGHKVLVANSDPMLALHATITGAKHATSPSTNPTGSSTEGSPTLPKSAKTGTDGPFYFKLVPPKAGLSRAVQFTKPTVHYFQCDTTAEGRKWMGEIMKATIQHDLGSFETTNKQKTISLAKARARKERPPALKEAGDKVPTVPEEKDDADAEDDDKENVTKPPMLPAGDAEKRESGLNIQGVMLGENDLKTGSSVSNEKAVPESAATG